MAQTELECACVQRSLHGILSSLNMVDSDREVGAPVKDVVHVLLMYHLPLQGGKWCT
jgi:hypothetical protein